MVGRRLVLKVLILLCLAPAAWSATDPVARIDRSVISVEDTLTLTIRVENASEVDSPDTTPLKENFHILGTAKSSRHSFVNGATQSSTEWKISLVPKREGDLRIPPIPVGQQHTQALSVSVQPAVPNPSAAKDPIFLESQVSAEQLYVQQQLIFTVRVFQSVQLDNMALSDIEIDNALVEKLSQNSFQRRINNQPYRVHEIRYAIFPQRSGSFTIPETVFTANEIDKRRSMFSVPGQGKPVRRVTQQHTIEVREPPASFAREADNPWLPAESLKLEETWSTAPEQVRVGESVTRRITVRARGLLHSQLPPHRFAELEGARYYPDQGESENTLSEQGASSYRTDSAAIIPTRAGTLKLPAVTIHWWDVRQDRLRKATLPARQIDVKPAPAGASGGSSPRAVDHSEPQPSPSPSTAGQTTAEGSSGLWPILTLVFGLLWLITLWLWWNAKQNPHTAAPSPGTAAPGTTTEKAGEKQCFKRLQQACREGDPRTIRRALIVWGEAMWPDQSVTTLADVQRHCDNPALSKRLAGLEQYLYGEAGGHWSADGLQTLLQRAREQALAADQRDNTGPQLPPLYGGS